MGPCLFLLEHLFCLSHRKTYWIMSVDNVGLKICLLGTSNSMVTLSFPPWCKPKWSWDEFNNQSQMLQGLWHDFMVHGVNNPYERIRIPTPTHSAIRSSCVYSLFGSYLFPSHSHPLESRWTLDSHHKNTRNNRFICHKARLSEIQTEWPITSQSLPRTISCAHQMQPQLLLKCDWTQSPLTFKSWHQVLEINCVILQ